MHPGQRVQLVVLDLALEPLPGLEHRQITIEPRREPRRESVILTVTATVHARVGTCVTGCVGIRKTCYTRGVGTGRGTGCVALGVRVWPGRRYRRWAGVGARVSARVGGRVGARVGPALVGVLGHQRPEQPVRALLDGGRLVPAARGCAQPGGEPGLG
ncbi:hypothetical protein GCM10027053_52690 [Intrasporangium mesophilum]